MSELLRGRCLIASRQLNDPNFQKTVVLIVEHGSHGAMGLVINRPSSILVSNALAKHFDLPDIDELVYVGGPVEPAALLVLHNVSELSGEEPEVIPDVFIGNSAEAFEDVVRRVSENDPALRFRIYSGCAGWAPGQLEGELERGDWHIATPSSQMVFHDDPYAVYELMLHRVLEECKILPPAPVDPQWN
ncbi:YqgE/AlgH family protein [bacterium]|nr:YqgE/AlgH family protein [bacterium]